LRKPVGHIHTPVKSGENQFGRFWTGRNTLHKTVKRVLAELANLKVLVVERTAAD
jgi:hypothetical protein